MSSKTFQEQLTEQWGQRKETASARPDTAPSILPSSVDESAVQVLAERVRPVATAKRSFVADAVGDRLDAVRQLEEMLGSRFDSTQLDGAVDRAIEASAPHPVALRHGHITAVKPELFRWEREVIKDPGNSAQLLRRILTFCGDPFAASILFDVVAECSVNISDGSLERVPFIKYAEVFASKSEYQELVQDHLLKRNKRERDRTLALADAELRRIAELRVPIDQVAQQIVRMRYDVNFTGPSLSMTDEFLCCCWANLRVPVRSKLEPAGLIKTLGGYHAMRLYSARQAEIIAGKYFEQFGSLVVDTSRYQATGEGEQWRTHDLEVDGVPVDVKNSRRSFSSPKNYSEHCVANWKAEDGRRRPVLLAGVLSEYITSDYYEAGIFGNAVFLGVLSLAQLVSSSAWFEAWTDGALQFIGLDKPKYFPGWVFDYPDKHYQTTVSPRDIDAAIESCCAVGLPHSEIPRWLLVHSGDGSALARRLVLGDLECEVLRSLVDVKLNVGLSRMSAVMFVLSTFVNSLRDSDSKAFSPDLLRDFIFTRNADGGIDTRHPFGRLDTEGFVNSMLSALAEAIRGAPRLLGTFRRFQLVAANILRGDDGSGAWTTILAYCGGFMPGPPHARCGKSPLVIGQSEVCPYCRHLICSSCGWCSKDCQQLETNPIRAVAHHARMDRDSDGI